MAQPIGATPILRGEEAATFITKLHKNAKKPVGLVATPKLEKARELIKKHSEHGQKRVR